MKTKIHSNHFSKLQDLRLEFITKIGEFFVNNKLETINFYRMFTVFVSEEERNGYYYKAPVIIKYLEDGKTLIGEDWEGNEYEMNLNYVESLAELAYILDVLEDGDYTVD